MKNKFKKKVFTKYLLISFLILDFIILSKNHFSKKKSMKVCLCTCGKKENLYVKEFVEHYKKYGVDKIFIYDNNDLNGEYFEETISNYIMNDYVKIINFRGQNKIQLKAMNDCYKKNFLKYDWFLFYDIDEFIFLKDFFNIKSFLNQTKFDDCKIILLNWVLHSDNDLIYYDNRSLFTRFKKKGKKIKNAIDVKPILRGSIITKINSVHQINDNRLKKCDGFGRKKYFEGINDKNPDYEFYYLDHFYSKSTEEFVNKILRGSVAYGPNKRFYILDNYFDINEITLEKIKYLEKKLNVNLTKYRNKIKNEKNNKK